MTESIVVCNADVSISGVIGDSLPLKLSDELSFCEFISGKVLIVSIKFKTLSDKESNKSGNSITDSDIAEKLSFISSTGAVISDKLVLNSASGSVISLKLFFASSSEGFTFLTFSDYRIFIIAYKIIRFRKVFENRII